jgi:polysaccharide biosynthesis protein PslE
VDRAVETLGKQLKVKIVPKTNLINVSYRSKDPKLAFEVLNNLANLYLEKHVAVHRPAGSYEFFTKEADRYREALQESEAHLASFDTQEGLVAPDEERTNMGLKLADSIAALHVAQQTIAADERRIHDVQGQMRATPQRSTTQQVSNSADLLLQQLQGNLLSAQVNRGQLLMKYDPSYPLVQQVDQQIKQTQTAIEEAEKTKYVNQTTDRDPTYEFLREDMAKTQADLASQKATSTALERSISTIREKMVELDQKALKQADLVRENKANEANYLLYLSKREQERTSDALDKKRIANVALAIPPAIPALPVHSAFLIGFLGIFLSIGIGMGAAYLAEYMDPSFRTPNEVVEMLQIPLVVAIPKLRA